MTKKSKHFFSFFLLTIVIVFIGSWIYNSDYFYGYRMHLRYKSKISLDDNPVFTDRKEGSFLPQNFDENARLFYICKIWGFLKYYHDNESLKGKIDVDKILINALHKNEKYSSRQELHKILEEIINSMQLSSLKANSIFPDISDYMLIDNFWMNDTVCLNQNITNQLKHIFTHHTGKENDFIVQNDIGRIRLINEPEYPETLPIEHIRLLGLFKYWNVINYFFVYKNLMDENWDQILYKSIPLFRQANTIQNYHLEIARLTNYLDDAHANMPVFEDRQIIGEYIPNFNIKNIRDTFVIQDIILPKQNAENFCPGDILLEIDGCDVYQLYDSLGQYVGSGSYWSEQRLIGHMMLSSKDSIQSFTILRNRKDTMFIESRNRSLEKINNQWYEENKKDTYYYWVNDSVAYLDLVFLNRKNFDQNFYPIKNAKVIILDLRGYSDNTIFEKTTDNFVPAGSLFFSVIYPDIRFPGMVRVVKKTTKVGSKSYFKGHIILLVNEGTGSFTEHLSMALQQNPKLITVGRSTVGSNGNIIQFMFPGNVETWFSGVGIYYPDMVPTQRSGIKIDYTVEPTVEDISKQKDVTLEKAKEIAINESY